MYDQHSQMPMVKKCVDKIVQCQWRNLLVMKFLSGLHQVPLCLIQEAEPLVVAAHWQASFF